MCGINVFFSFQKNHVPGDIESIVHVMNNSIVHRGPDSEGCYFNEHVGLGMRRLAIIDLATGEQPIFNEDKSKVIVANGEIYNYVKLRSELKTKGHIFSTETDTEVILHLYEEYGSECLKKLNGMFAFAIYNISDDTLFVSRDAAGEKPLYYYKNENFMLFASELKSIINTGLFEKRICNAALAQYLQLTYIPAPLTIFEGVYKLPQAAYMNIASDGTIKKEIYWDVSYDSSALINDRKECEQLLRETVYRAVERHMVSDVPIGTFLSGGIDSTVVTAIASELQGKPIDTFNIGFYDRECDESEKAQIVAKRYGTRHHLHMLKDEEAFMALPDIIANMDEPFADSSIVATYIVAREAAKEVKVILTGDAGDELFGGYSKYAMNYYADKYKSIPPFIRKRLIEPVWAMLPDNSILSRQVGKVIRNADKEYFAQCLSLMCLGFKQNELKVLSPELPEDTLNFVSDYYNRLVGADEITKTLYTDLKVVLEGDMFVKSDRAAMLTSIETRTPLIDPAVIDIAYKIPSRFKIHGSRLKDIFKQTFSDLIPSELLNASKHGFGVPVSSWLKNELQTEMLGYINRDFLRTQGIFQYDYIEAIYKEHLDSKVNRSGELWSFYIFQKWYEKWLG